MRSGPPRRKALRAGTCAGTRRAQRGSRQRRPRRPAASPPLWQSSTLWSTRGEANYAIYPGPAESIRLLSAGEPGQPRSTCALPGLTSLATRSDRGVERGQVAHVGPRRSGLHHAVVCARALRALELPGPCHMDACILIRPAPPPPPGWPPPPAPAGRPPRAPHSRPLQSQSGPKPVPRVPTRWPRGPAGRAGGRF